MQAYKFEDGEPVHLPDSLSKEFRTANGRIVRDGGGITPDVTLAADSLPGMLTEMANSNQLFDFCVNYRNTHATIASAKDFRLTNEEYANFCAFMKKNKFSYDRRSLQVLKALRTVAHYEGYDTDAAAELDALEKKLQHNEDYDFKRWEKDIRQLVESTIVERYYYDSGREQYQLQTDKDVQAAIQMLHNRTMMHKILSGEPDA